MTSHSQQGTLAISTIILLMIALFYIAVWQKPPEYDEMDTFYTYATSPVMAFFNYSKPNNHILNTVLVWLGTTLMGDSLIAIRLPSVAFGLLTVAYTMRLGRRLHSAQAGWLAAVLLVAMPLFSFFMVNARGYTLSTFLTLVLAEIVLFMPLRQRATQRWLIALTMALLLTLPSMVLLIAAVLVYLFIRYRGSALRDSVLPIVIGGILAGMVYMGSAARGVVTKFTFAWGEPNPFVLVTQVLNEVIPGIIGIIIGVGVCVGIVVLWRQKRWLGLWYIALPAVAIGLSGLQFLITGRVLYLRNGIYLLPFLAMIAGAGWATLIGRNRVVTFGILCVIGLWGIYPLLRLNAPNEAVRINEIVLRNRRSDDYVLVGCCYELQILYLNRHTPPLQSLRDDAIVLIPTDYDPLIALASLAAVNPQMCQPSQWETLEIYRCPWHVLPAD